MRWKLVLLAATFGIGIGYPEAWELAKKFGTHFESLDFQAQEAVCLGTILCGVSAGMFIFVAYADAQTRKRDRRNWEEAEKQAEKTTRLLNKMDDERKERLKEEHAEQKRTENRLLNETPTPMGKSILEALDEEGWIFEDKTKSETLHWWPELGSTGLWICIIEAKDQKLLLIRTYPGLEEIEEENFTQADCFQIEMKVSAKIKILSDAKTIGAGLLRAGLATRQRESIEGSLAALREKKEKRQE